MASDKKLLALAEAIKNKYGISVDISKVSPSKAYEELSTLSNELDTLQKSGRYQDYSGDYKLNFYNSFGERNLYGMYDPRQKGVVNINSARYSPRVLDTLIHERQHLLDFEKQAGASLFPMYAISGAGGIDAKYSPTSNNYTSDAINITDKLIQAYEKYSKKYKLPEDFITDPWVELKAIERQLPVGKGIMDTDIGQELFKDNPMFRAMYYNLTSNGAYLSNPLPQDKETVSNEKTYQKGLFESFQDWVKSKTRY